MTALVAATILLPILILVLARRLLPGTPEPPASSAASLAPATGEADAARRIEDRTPEIQGRILDAEGNPVDAAAVRLVSSSPPETVYRETKTDAGGRFSLARLPVRRARVIAEHDPEGIAVSADLAIAQGQTTELTLVLSAASTLRGAVVDGDDRPIEGATLSVEGTPWIARRTTSDASGAFRLTTVPLEATSLVAVARGFRTARVTLAKRADGTELTLRVRLAAAPGVEGDVHDPDGNPVKARVVACEGQPAEARTVTADDGTFQLPASAIGCDAVAEHDDFGRSEAVAVVEASHLTLRLSAGGSIAGVVVDERGEGVPKFNLGVESFSTPHGRTLRTGGRKTFEDVRGAFVWDKLAPGRYVLTASAPGKPPARSEAIAVLSGTVTRGVRIAIPRGGTLTGHVYDESHGRLAGVDLRFDAISAVLESATSARTDESGWYRLEGAPAGPFTLRVQKDGFRLRLISGLRVAGGGELAQDVTLTALDGGATFEFGGIGANLQQSPDGISFAAVFPGDPAARGGMLAGDRIVGVDGQSVAGLSIADVLQLLRGQAGTMVGVSVHRPSTGEDLDVAVERATIAR